MFKIKNIVNENFIKLLFQHNNTKLGRWNIDYSNKMDLKIKLANEDHCGSCNQYNHNKKPKKS
jgi:hypothetical protein